MVTGIDDPSCSHCGARDHALATLLGTCLQAVPPPADKRKRPHLQCRHPKQTNYQACTNSVEIHAAICAKQCRSGMRAPVNTIRCSEQLEERHAQDMPGCVGGGQEYPNCTVEGKSVLTCTVEAKTSQTALCCFSLQRAECHSPA